MEGEPRNLHERAEEPPVRGSDDPGGRPEERLRRPQHKPDADRHRHLRTRQVSVLPRAIGHSRHNRRRKVHHHGRSTQGC